MTTTAAPACAHLMIVHERYAPLLLSGRKAVESRLSKDRRAPFGRVSPGEVVYLKTTGGPVFARARVTRVDEFDDLTPGQLDSLRSAYDDRVCADDAYWDERSDARYATMVWLGEVRPVTDAARVPAALLSPSRHAWRTVELDDGSPNHRRAA